MTEFNTKRNNSTMEKKELQNKLQGFQEGKDYSVSSTENGKWVYDILSQDLKKSLWGDRIPVWCKVEVYDNENEHYRGRFEGYENGYRSLQVWWRGENSNPEHLKIWGSSHPDFEHFKEETERFFENTFSVENFFKVQRSIGNVFDDWKITSCRFGKGSIENNFSDSKKEQKWNATFDPPSDLPTCQCNLAIRKTCLGDRNRCLKCGGIFGNTNRENIRNACWDCGKFEISEEMIENGRVRCNECDNKYGSYLQEKSKENEQKNQQITSLKEENKTLNQKLETERQAKKEAERSLEESKIQQEQAQIELTQLQEELVKVKQELTQAQEKLKEQMEKSPQTNTEQLIERLEKSGKDLTASQKLVQNPKLNHQDLIEVKDQLDNSRRILAAAAAHTQSVEKASQLQAQVKPTKIHEQSNKTNYLPYLVGGLVISGSLVLGLFFWQKKKNK